LDWIAKFKSSLTFGKDAYHSRHPLTSKTSENMEKVKELSFENRRINYS
jgi:hypothetical protein